MSISEVFMNFIQIDPRSAIAILFMGNLTLSFMIFGYYLCHSDIKLKRQLKGFGFAKITQALAWCFLFLIDSFPIWLGGILGNDLLFLGMYLESVTMLSMIKREKGLARTFLNIILLVTIVSFNVMVFSGAKPYIRVALASIGVFVILMIPTLLYIVDKNSSVFKKMVGTIYVIFLSTLPFRAFISITNPGMTLFTSNLIQTVTFISLNLILIVGGTGFLLLFKEDADLELARMATLDPLTQIPNRRHFMNESQLIFELHKRTQDSLAIVFIDVDHFKCVNDTYGHRFGDEVLKMLARIIREQIREVDQCCRFGGEEFVILLSASNSEGAIIFGERIQALIETSHIVEQPDFSFTVSIGIFSKVPQSEDRLEIFIDKSDDSLYRAKAKGRNCIEVSSPEQ